VIAGARHAFEGLSSAFSRPHPLAAVATAVLGAALVAGAQTAADKRLVGVACAAVTLLALGVIRRVYGRNDRRGLELSAFAVAIITPVAADVGMRVARSGTQPFLHDAQAKRVAIPLMFVLFAALLLDRSLPRLRLCTTDVAFMALATIVTLPALALGLANHNELSPVGQDLGLIVFATAAYGAGRAALAPAERSVDRVALLSLLALGVGTQLYGLTTLSVLYSYYVAAAAAAPFYALRRRRDLWLLLPAAFLLVRAVQTAGASSLHFQVVTAVAALGYLLLRTLNRWVGRASLVAGAAAVALVAATTSAGSALIGTYAGPDPSLASRTTEARQVRRAVDRSTLALALGAGLGATVDLSGTPRANVITLEQSGRDIHHVNDVHLLEYEFLLKWGVLGLLWLAAFLLALLVVLFRAGERWVSDHEPRIVLYSLMVMTGLVEGSTAATSWFANPLPMLMLGMLVSAIAVPRRAQARG